MHLTQKIVGRYFNETCSLWSIKVIVTAAVKKISCLRDQTEQKPVIFVIFAFIFKLKPSPALLITIIYFFLSFDCHWFDWLVTFGAGYSIVQFYLSAWLQLQ